MDVCMVDVTDTPCAVPNHISLDSYMDNFLMMIFIMGLVFELPLLCWLLGRLGIVHRGLFNRYRRHAIVVLLVVAAFITPTGDAMRRCGSTDADVLQ